MELTKRVLQYDWMYLEGRQCPVDKTLEDFEWEGYADAKNFWDPPKEIYRCLGKCNGIYEITDLIVPNRFKITIDEKVE